MTFRVAVERRGIGGEVRGGGRCKCERKEEGSGGE